MTDPVEKCIASLDRTTCIEASGTVDRSEMEESTRGTSDCPGYSTPVFASSLENFNLFILTEILIDVVGQKPSETIACRITSRSRR